LTSSDEERKSPAGRKLDYQRRLEVNRKRRLDSIEPFLYFKNLPAEIRIKIWEFSLPGPRTLCPGYPPEPEKEMYMRRSSLAYVTFVEPPSEAQTIYGQTSLFFPKDHQAPKPAALDVCRESRYIALQRYRLCFGTTNIYADLDTDVLYFGPAYNGQLGRGGKVWGWVERGNSDVVIYPAPEVVADLERVKRLGYKYTCGWVNYDELFGNRDGNGHLLRKDLARFKGLEEVLLSHAPEDISSYEEPGHVAFNYFEGWEAKARPKILVQSGHGDGASLSSAFDGLQQLSDDQTEDSSSRAVPTNESLSDAGSHNDASDAENFPKRRAERTISSFKTRYIKDAEKERGIPTVNLIVAERVPNIPAFASMKVISQV